MKIFASWSGDDSRAVAELLRDWIPKVIQEVDVWVSSQDIGKGEKWSTTLWSTLSEHDVGILLLTKSNLLSPWIQFEAGALSKSVKSRVIPILCDLEQIDVAKTPLSHLQGAKVSHDDLYEVVKALNGLCSRPLPHDRLAATFEKWWPDFSADFEKIVFTLPGEPKLTENDRLERIESALESIITTVNRTSKPPPATVQDGPSRTSVLKDLLASLDNSKSVDKLTYEALQRDMYRSLAKKQKEED